MFQITPGAAKEILAAAVRSEAEGMALRVAARQIADGSIEYGMGFDEEREDDEPVEFGALKVLLGAPSRPLLEATELDYVEIEPGRFDFVFVPAAAAQALDDGAGKPGSGASGSGGCSGCAA